MLALPTFVHSNFANVHFIWVASRMQIFFFLLFIKYFVLLALFKYKVYTFRLSNQVFKWYMYLIIYPLSSGLLLHLHSISTMITKIHYH
jgi:hypothetical protein